MSADHYPKASITPTVNGPYVIKDLKKFSNRNGPIRADAQAALCRCGGSSNKPFCDGTHWHKKFTDDKN